MDQNKSLDPQETYDVFRFPNFNLSNTPSLISLRQEGDEVIISLKDNSGSRYELKFSGVFAVRSVQERFSICTINKMHNLFKDGQFCFFIENSGFYNEFSKESLDTISDLNINHIKIIFISDIIDILISRESDISGFQI